MKRLTTGVSILAMICLLVAGAALVFAGDSSTELTVDQAVQLAMQNSLLRQLALGEAAIASEKKAQAASGYWPKLTLNGGATRFSEVPTDIELGAKLAQLNNALHALGLPLKELPDDSLLYYGYQLVIEQPLYTGNKLGALNKQAKANENAAKANLEAADQNLVYEVKKSYYSVLQIQRSVQTLREAVKSMEEHVKEANSYYNAGMVPKLDVMRAEVKLADLKQKLLMAENGLTLTKKAFNFVLGVDLGTEYRLVDDLDYRPLAMDLAACQKAALAGRPELQSVKAKVEMARQGVAIAKSGYKPMVALRAEKEDTEPYTENPLSYSLVATMKIFDGGLVAHQVAEAEDVLNQALISQELVERKIKLEVEQAYHNVIAALDAIEVARKSMDQAQETARMADISYQSGLSTSLERIDAEVGLTQAKSNYTQALSLYNIALADLQRAIGLHKEESL